LAAELIPRIWLGFAFGLVGLIKELIGFDVTRFFPLKHLKGSRMQAKGAEYGPLESAPARVILERIYF
jgi:hypothetical protein